MQNNPPTISVILPVYNTGYILQETIDSVLNQTFRDFELVIINDGSSEPVTLKILQEQPDPRVRVVNQSNCGVAAARNRGIQEAAGKYIAFLDHDDIFLPGKLALLLDELEKSPETVLAYTGVIPFGKNAGKAHVLPDDSDISYTMLLCGNVIYSMSCVMLPAATVRNNDISFDDRCVPCDDWDFYLQCAKFGRIRQVFPPQVQYRLHENNQSNNLVKMYLAGLRIADKHRSNIKATARTLQISAGKLKRAANRASAGHYYGLAYYFFRQKQFGNAIKNFFQAFISNPFYSKLPHFVMKKAGSLFRAQKS